MPDETDVSENRVFAAPANGPAQETTIPPDQIDELFDQADLAAALEQIARTLDQHRRQLLLLWLDALFMAGLITLIAWQRWREVRVDA